MTFASTLCGGCTRPGHVFPAGASSARNTSSGAGWRAESRANARMQLLAGELDRIRSGKAPDELVRLAGSLELIPHDTKAELVSRFIDVAATLARAKRHCGSLFCGTRSPAQPGSALRRAGDRRLARPRRARVLRLPRFRLGRAGAAGTADTIPPGRARRRRSGPGRGRATAPPDCRQAGEVWRPPIANSQD